MKKLFLILFCALIALPTMLTTKIGIDYVVIPLAERNANAKVSVGDLSFGWFSSFEAKNLVIEKGERTLRVNEAKSTQTLLSFLWNGLSIQNLQANGQTGEGKFDANISLSENEPVLDVVLSEFPISFIDPSLIPHVGETLNLTANLDQELVINWTTPLLSGEAVGVLEGEQFRLTKPMNLSYIYDITVEELLIDPSGKLVTKFKSDELSGTVNLDKSLNATLHFREYDLELSGSDLAMVKVNLKSDRLNGSGVFKLGPTITALKPATLVWKAKLDEPRDVKFDLQKVTIPIADKGWEHLSADLNISIETLFKGTASTQDLAKDVLFSLNGNGSQMSGHALNLFTEEGLFNRTGLSVDLSIITEKAKTELWGSLFHLDPSIIRQINAVIGKEVDSEITLSLKEMKGPVFAKVQGPNGYFSLDGNLNKGFLTLNEPFVSEVKVTPELGHSFLDEVMPLLSTAMSADQPIHIVVDPEGFQFPLQNFELSKIRVLRSMLSLGKIGFRNEGTLSDILSLMSIQSGDFVEVWFTPLYAKMENGQLYLARMDFLAAREVPLAIWGDIDLVNDQVKLKLGLTPKALETAFGMKGLPASYMMQVPIKGSTSHAKLDSGRAAAKISALVAQMQGSTEGMVIGSVLDLIGGTLGEEKAPPPSTDPLPWNTSSQSVKNDTKQNPTVGDFLKKIKW